MARALRIERSGARYHVTARGNERKPIYRDDRDRSHFLELLGEATGRFSLRVHPYVLIVDYAAVGQAISRFGRRLAHDPIQITRCNPRRLKRVRMTKEAS